MINDVRICYKHHCVLDIFITCPTDPGSVFQIYFVISLPSFVQQKNVQELVSCLLCPPTKISKNTHPTANEHPNPHSMAGGLAFLVTSNPLEPMIQKKKSHVKNTLH